jgi:acyl-CoA reductase-like NAD-dependent aldehyde dehydrogenase
MRVRVSKTLKLYVGGEFVRSESGRTLAVRSTRGEVMHVSRASRKDLREALEKARAAQPGWWKRSGYNRGQILYRLAEMLEDRGDALPTDPSDRSNAIDRVVHHAGWTDKITALLSSLNPVANTYVNYSMVCPVGLVVAAPRPQDGLLGMVEALGATLIMGNTSVLLVAHERAELATALAEALATSDVPAGVVNVLTGDLGELLGAANGHDDIDALYLAEGAVEPIQVRAAEEESARMMRRILTVTSADDPATPHQLVRLAEVKTVWMSC